MLKIPQELSIKKSALDRKRVEDLYSHENAAYAEGIELIAGVDEAGRGSLAGPVAVGACILPKNVYIPMLNDSKKLSASWREKVYEDIKKIAVAYSFILIDEKTIDKINILEATKLGMKQAIENLSVKPQKIFTDAVRLENFPIPSEAIIHGDAISASIAAASIIAKVERDHLMLELDKKFPQYGFAQHKGYGTKSHIEAIMKFGPSEIHRRSYAPVKFLVK